MKLPKPTIEREACPAGNHLGICWRLIDLGTQETSYQGTVRHQHKIYIEWLLPNERNADDEPHVVGKRYTLSSSEKSNLRQDLESWRGRRFTDADFEGADAFDLRRVLGAACLVSVIHNERDGKRYADVQSIAAVPKGTPTPSLHCHPVYLSLDPDDFDQTVFDGLGERLRQAIAESPEYQQLAANAGSYGGHDVDNVGGAGGAGGDAVAAETYDEIPF